MSLARRYIANDKGAVTVEAAFISTIMIALTIAAFELCYGFFQWNKAQQAARIGARLAATSTPVAAGLFDMTGLTGNVQPGDPMPDYSFECDGNSGRCSSGGYDAQALNRLIYGPDNDGTCGPTERARQGMCDLFGPIKPENISITYQASGLGRAGNPGLPAPLVTVTVKDVEFSFAVLNSFTPKSVRTIPNVSVTVMAEDLKSGA